MSDCLPQLRVVRGLNGEVVERPFFPLDSLYVGSELGYSPVPVVEERVVDVEQPVVGESKRAPVRQVSAVVQIGSQKGGHLERFVPALHRRQAYGSLAVPDKLSERDPTTTTEQRTPSPSTPPAIAAHPTACTHHARGSSGQLPSRIEWHAKVAPDALKGRVSTQRRGAARRRLPLSVSCVRLLIVLMPPRDEAASAA